MYQAFISYSHRADARLAPVLQRALERLGTPWWRRAPLRVFRDDSSLPASAALWPAIERGLRESQHFLLLASPASAASPWVDKEVQWWLANRPHDRLLIAVTAGRIAYLPAAGDFDWAATDCLPPAMRGMFGAEPLWTDLRFVTGPEHLSLRHSGFRSAALGLAAAIRGVAKDDLERIDIRQHRRATFAAAGALCTLAALGIATVLAVRVARDESASARANLLQAESRRLAAEALQQLDGGKGIETATLKAAIAWRLSPTDDARRALQRIDEQTPDVARVLAQHTSGARAAAFSRDRQRLATLGEDGVVLQWSLADGRQTGVPLATERQWVREFRFSRDGSHLLVAGTRSAEPRWPTLAVFRMADGARLPIGDGWRSALGGRPDQQDKACTALSPAGTRAAAVRGDTLVAITTSSGAHTTLQLPQKLQITALGFVDENRLRIVAAGLYGNSLRAGQVDLASGSITLGPPQRLQTAYGCDGFTNFSDDGLRVVLPGALTPVDSDDLLLWRIDERLALHLLPMPVPRPRLIERTGHHAPEFDAGGRRIAYGVGGRAYVWEPDTQRMIKTLPRLGDGHGPALALSADGSLLAAIDSFTPVIWSLDGDATARRIEGSRCGNGRLEDDCIRRLCERITPHLDEAQARILLGARHRDLLEALNGSACAGQGAPRSY